MLRYFWHVDAVRCGLESDFIMSALLAVSALHMVYRQPTCRDSYAAKAIHLHQKSSRSAARLMARQSQFQGLSVFLFSVLTVYFGKS
jgi:gluconate kinase